VRELMAEMGYRKLDDIIGRVRLARQGSADRPLEGAGLDFSGVLQAGRRKKEIYWTERQKHPIDDMLDRKLIEAHAGAGKQAEPVRIDLPIHNVDRSAGAMLSGELAKRIRPQGACRRHHHVKLTGTAGQSFGAFLAKGVTFDLSATATTMSARACAAAAHRAAAGNARSCRRSRSSSATPCFTARSRASAISAASRASAFAVRNSGAAAVVEGCRRPWLRIHDRRRRRRARRDGPQLRGRHVGRRRLCARRGQAVRDALQHGHGRAGAGAEEDDILEKLHHHGGDLEHKGRVDVSGDMTRHDEERLFQLISNHRYTGSTARG
jgi:glutamate synthase (NADPH/NADH) large chain